MNLKAVNCFLKNQTVSGISIMQMRIRLIMRKELLSDSYYNTAEIKLACLDDYGFEIE